MPADVTLPDDINAMASSLMANRPGLSGGRGELGVLTPYLDTGVFFWSGTLTFGLADDSMAADRGRVEGAIGAYMQGRSIGIPLGRSNSALLVFENAAGNEFTPAATAKLEAAANGRLRLAGARSIRAMPGLLLSVGDKLYQCVHTGERDLTSFSLVTLPEWPNPSAGTEIEFRDPRPLGVRPEGITGVSMPQDGSGLWGPVSLQWVEK